MTKLGLLALVVVLAGCERGTLSTEGVEETSHSKVELTKLLPPDSVVVGATIAPDGKRYVLDQRSGLYEIQGSSARLVLNVTGLGGVQLTDVVALDSWRFALTAENDGSLFDARTGQLDSYFCYLPSPPTTPEPGPMGQGGGPPIVLAPLSISQTLQLEGVAVSQKTESVAFNPNTRQLFAQPRTVRLDSGAVAGSELFVFAEAGGEPVRVVPIPDPAFVAGGMVVVPGDRLLLGAKSIVYELSLDGQVFALRELDEAVDIRGMTLDENGDVWILDGAARQLVKLGPL